MLEFGIIELQRGIAVKEIFIFIDGVGLAPAGPDNPVAPSVCPFLCSLIEKHSKPVDACLGIDGLPQSATGQSAIFTGHNASAFMGRHVEGFPGPTLRRFVETDNVFLTLKKLGKKAKFADAYLSDTVDEIRNRRFRSVTTTAALTVPETLSLKADLFANQAVLHDITRDLLVQKGYQGAHISPETAAEHLIQLALGYDYTLFEYFLTDRAGHSGNFDTAASTLSCLDTFFSAMIPVALELNFGITIISDHGNIEAISVKGHTRNPVPLIALGPKADEIISSCENLTDVTPAVLAAMTSSEN